MRQSLRIQSRGQKGSGPPNATGAAYELRTTKTSVLLSQNAWEMMMMVTMMTKNDRVVVMVMLHKPRQKHPTQALPTRGFSIVNSWRRHD